MLLSPLLGPKVSRPRIYIYKFTSIHLLSHEMFVRREAGKRCMACTRCGEDRPVDVVEWDLPPPCRACKRSSVVEDQIQVTRDMVSTFTS